MFAFWFAIAVFVASNLLGCDYVPPLTPDAGACPPCPDCPPPPPPPEPDAAKYAMQCQVHGWGFTFEELGIDPSECVEFKDGPWGLDAGVEWRGVEHYCKCIVHRPFAFEGERWIFKGVSPEKETKNEKDGGVE